MTSGPFVGELDVRPAGLRDCTSGRPRGTVQAATSGPPETWVSSPFKESRVNSAEPDSE